VNVAQDDGARASGPLATALSGAAELLSGESGTSRRFIGGLVIGALVGAAVAGGTFLRSRAVGPPLREPKPDPGAESLTTGGSDEA
jgi:hypothetical protein